MKSHPAKPIRTAVFANLVTALAFVPIALGVAFCEILPNPIQAAEFDNAEDLPGKNQPDASEPQLGLLVNQSEAFQGYTLLASANSTITYLIDMQGRVVQTWKSDCIPGLSTYLLDNGHLRRTGQIKNPPFFGGGTGGRIQEFTWDGKIIWDFTYFSETELPNHDVCKLPNGNILMIVWQKKTAQDALAAGRRPETVTETGLLDGCILEIQPTGKTTGKIVWQWRAWDHLVQDFDATRTNYGNVDLTPGKTVEELEAANRPQTVHSRPKIE